MPDPRASQLPSPTHVLCEVFVLLTKATSHNIASTPSQTATHGTQQGQFAWQNKEPFALLVKKEKKDYQNPSPPLIPAPLSRSQFAQIASDSDSTLAVRRQQEFVPFRPCIDSSGRRLLAQPKSGSPNVYEVSELFLSFSRHSTTGNTTRLPFRRSLFPSYFAELPV